MAHFNYCKVSKAMLPVNRKAQKVVRCTFCVKMGYDERGVKMHQLLEFVLLDGFAKQSFV